MDNVFIILSFIGGFSLGYLRASWYYRNVTNCNGYVAQPKTKNSSDKECICNTSESGYCSKHHTDWT